MKLLFLNLYSGAVERGAETFTTELVSRLGDTHQVRLAMGHSTLTPQSQFTGSLANRLLKRFFLDQPARQVLAFTFSYLGHIIKSDYDAIFPLNGFWQLLLLKLLQPFKGFKIIVTGHSGPGWDERWNLYLNPTYFVATTKPTLIWAQKTCPWTKSVLIPYAIDASPNLDNLPPLKITRPIILCPAALVPYKRIDLAIRAVAKLGKGSLLVLGKGPLKKSLQQLGTKLLPSRFLLKAVPNQEMSKYYQSSSIVTLPSDPQENSPMVFLEALANGKMVVTTDTPRNRWILEEAGIYIKPQNINSYARALEEALSHSLNTNQALKKFTWQSVLKKYNQLLHE